MKHCFWTGWLLLFFPSLLGAAGFGNGDFCTLGSRDGLSNSQVNAIFRDRDGFIWMGTESGLDRFDGFRFKNFFFRRGDHTSLPNNSVDEIQQDALGRIWVHTAVGYCIYDHRRERFDSNLATWMHVRGMGGLPDRVLVDGEGNLWLNTTSKGCYFYDVHRKQPVLFSPDGRGQFRIPRGEVTAFTPRGTTVVLTYRDGMLVCIDGYHKRVVWINREVPRHSRNTVNAGRTFIDGGHNYWMLTDAGCLVYSVVQHRWFSSPDSFFRAMKVHLPVSPLLVKAVRVDMFGRTLIATDHSGLVVVDWKKKTCQVFLYDPRQIGSLPDNTLQAIYCDRSGGIWIGTYKNGVAYYSSFVSRFSTLPLGDVCSICEDRQGRLWCGTNENGIVCYDPITGKVRTFHAAQTGLGSEVVVSTLAARDGSLYFGTYKGGMARYRNGQWKVFRARNHPGGLVSDNVWCLFEDRTGHIAVGTLGGGLQLMDPVTERFSTFDTMHSNLPSDYINSLGATLKGDLLVGHSRGYSIFVPETRRLYNYSSTKDGRPFFSPSMNQVFQDSRGILWMATPAGISFYDPQSGILQSVNVPGGSQGAVGCSVVEDQEGEMWLVYDHAVSRVRMSRTHRGKWMPFITGFNSLDGLQERQFNYRSILLTHRGEILIGGQDGINVIRPRPMVRMNRRVSPLFSGLILFDYPLAVGEVYGGRTILKEALEQSRRLELQHDENSFTVLLATNEVTIPARYRFLYRIDGLGQKWMMTAEEKPSVTFTNLSPGTYRLQVRVVNVDGTADPDINTLTIHIQPPFYFSIWAILTYIILVLAVVYLYYRRMLRHQKRRFEVHQREAEASRKRELDELKLNFFTNVSHELRTPLTLILTPLAQMIKEEDRKGERGKLQLVQRNAERLLALVNQLLDLRKMDRNEERLNAISGDIVDFVRKICNSFRTLGGRGIHLSFTASVPILEMDFDPDKMGKIIDNLLSNAWKFTPVGGHVDVALKLVDKAFGKEQGLELSVADTGRGISDADKHRVFDRFFQVRASEMQPFGGSGIGLNLVRKFTELHGGRVEVHDRPGGGSVFLVTIPVHQTSSEPVPSSENRDTLPVAVSQTLSPATGEGKRFRLLLVDDSDDFRTFMSGVLSEWYEVVLAVDGRDALRQVRLHRPDVILSDVMMPVMDGNAFCRKIKSDPETDDIPFVMLTARLSQEQETEGLALGADDYVTKPFSIDSLHLRIDHLIQRHVRGESVSPQSLSDRKEPVIPETDRCLLSRAEQFVRAHLDDPDVTVEALSAEVNMSRVQLYKRLVGITGSTPSEFIRGIRLKASEQLLCESGLTVSEIAYRVGFNNPRYFSRYFAETYGMTPSQYRKKWES